jgi:outer membrane protein
MWSSASTPYGASARLVLAGIGGALIVMALPPCASPGRAETMSGALARAYAGNPDMNQQRAGVRATDENLPRATSTWRPTANANAQYGYNHLDETSASGNASASGAATGIPSGSGKLTPLRTNTASWNYGLTVTQNLFNGNRTVNGVRQAESNIFGARETMRNTEENVLLNGATAYMNVLRDTAILDLRKNNIIVLQEQLRQTVDRFTVGEVTRTDVAQAESSLATARSDYFTAQANLETSIANYRQVIGVEPTRLEPARTIEHQRLFEDPAPPALSLVWGFGGGGARRRFNRTKDFDRYKNARRIFAKLCSSNVGTAYPFRARRNPTLRVGLLGGFIDEC